MKYHTFSSLLISSLCLLAIGRSSGDGASGTAANLVPECVEDASGLEGWLCPSDLTVECQNGGTDPQVIYLTPSGFAVFLVYPISSSPAVLTAQK